jgi:hypothetical protein
LFKDNIQALPATLGLQYGVAGRPKIIEKPFRLRAVSYDNQQYILI